MKSRLSIFAIIFLLFFFGCASPAPLTGAPSTETADPPRVAFLPTMTLPAPTRVPMGTRIPLPPPGNFYHGVFPGGRTGEEDDITINDLRSYENTVGKTVAWVYFSNNWYRDRSFPAQTAQWIRDAGGIPYIRLMLRSGLKHNGEEKVFTLQNILDGQFDQDLHAWCAGARDFGSPLLAEYGTEVNSDSFVWSGASNGAGKTNGYGDPLQPDGPEMFRDVYRRIIQTCDDEKAVNITWVFHVDGEDHPRAAWNRLENYYPGDEWIDWIGVSIYGAYSPQYPYWNVFQPTMDAVYARLETLAPGKPVIVAEFGTAKDNPLGDQAEWAREALTSITSSRYPNVIGFAWWNERWQNDGNRDNDTTMRVQDNPDLAAVFRQLVGDAPGVLGRVFP